MNSLSALTIDVEEYFQVHAFSDVIRRKDWDSLESRVEKSTYRLLDLLDSTDGQPTTDHGPGGKPRATFFILGWIAERYPALVREIHSRGHEVACHGYIHQLVNRQSRESFTKDVAKAKQILEDLIGVEVIGYRAPSFSITKHTLCALEILCELGFRYDSSIFPIRHDFYGIPGAPRYPFLIDFSNGNLASQLKNPKYLHKIGNYGNSRHRQPNDSTSTGLFIEFPLTTFSVLGLNLPCSGGGYFRTFPYWFTRWGLKRIHNSGLSTAIFYLHPWELDLDFPRIKGSTRRARFRTYVNLKKTESRFKRLLNDFNFVPLKSIL